MTDIESNPLSTITAKAKEKWKKNLEQQKKLKAKSSKKKSNKKRSLKQTNTNKKYQKNGPPFKKRKVNQSKSLQKRNIDYDLPLEKQKQRSVIKLQKMPTGLEEREMSIFFKQFGNVTRFCLKRHRYGRSLRYAYVEFDHPEVANIVVHALDCTSMYGEMLVCTEIPPEKVNGSQFFKTNSIKTARLFKKHDNAKRRWNNVATITNLEFQFDEWHQQLINDEQIINDNLNKNGFQYQFDGFKTEITRQMEKSNGDDAVVLEMKHNTNFSTEKKKIVTEKVASFLSDNDSDV